MRIQRLARSKTPAIIAADRIEEGSRIRAAHIVHAHVRNIEQAGRIARGKVFLENPRVLHRHLPTRKWDHSATCISMDLIQGCFPEFTFDFIPDERRQRLFLNLGADSDKPGLDSTFERWDGRR